MCYEKAIIYASLIILKSDYLWRYYILCFRDTISDILEPVPLFKNIKYQN
jgi:hypothetical protein